LFNPFTPFGPVPEKAGDAPFIDRTPAEIINSGDVADVPWVTGIVSEEGLYPVSGKTMHGTIRKIVVTNCLTRFINDTLSL